MMNMKDEVFCTIQVRKLKSGKLQQKSCAIYLDHREEWLKPEKEVLKALKNKDHTPWEKIEDYNVCIVNIRDSALKETIL